MMHLRKKEIVDFLGDEFDSLQFQWRRCFVVILTDCYVFAVF